MSEIRFSCLECGQHLLVGVSAVGTMVSCPACAAFLTVPPPAVPPRLPKLAARIVKRKAGPIAILVFGIASILLVGLGFVAGIGLSRDRHQNHASSTVDEMVFPSEAVGSVTSRPAIQILRRYVSDSLPTSGIDSQSLMLNSAEVAAGLSFLVVQVQLPTATAATYPVTKPKMGASMLSLVQPSLDALRFAYVLHAESFKLTLPSGRTTDGSFIKWPDHDTWCRNLDTTLSVVLSGSDVCIAYSAWSLIVATNADLESLTATIAFKVPRGLAEHAELEVEYDPLATPPPIEPVDVVTVTPVDQPETFQLPFDQPVVPVMRAVQPAFKAPMPASPNQMTVANKLNTWLGVGVFTRKVGSAYRFGAIQGVAPGGSITFGVPNGQFDLYWIRQDKPASRFRHPQSFSITGGNARYYRTATATIGSNSGETPVEEFF